MRILKARIRNYKSYLDSGDIVFAPGINVIVGKNDAGKSAVMEALSLSFGAKPHKSINTLPKTSSAVDPHSRVEMSFLLEPEDIQSFLSGYQNLAFPLHGNLHNNDAPRLLQSFLSSPIEFFMEWVDGSPSRQEFKVKEFSSAEPAIVVGNIGYPTDLTLRDRNRSASNADAMTLVRDGVRSNLYGFKAERHGRGSYPIDGSETLNSDAANLPSALLSLNAANPHRYAELMRHVGVVFPEIQGVTIKIINNQANAFIWSVPLSSQRSDLAIPLSDSGTGISQVLSILYVIVNSDTPKSIVIDEPQSFLHPGAFRKLVEIIRQYSHHQYIITTHSPAALIDSDTVFIVRRHGQKTDIEKVAQGDREASRDFLLEVGARLSDVFGADSVLWVEGKTEEVCFPVVLREMAQKPLAGVQILSLIQTGDLNKKDASRVLNIYSSLSRGPTLMPQALAFILDDEGRSDREKDDLNRLADHQVKWLPRRLFENYLVDAVAIATVLNMENLEESFDEQVVQAWISANAKKKKYWKNVPIESYPSSAWSKHVNAAELLKDLFIELTDSKLAYDKVRHGLRLTETLTERSANDMKELSAFLVRVLDAENTL